MKYVIVSNDGPAQILERSPEVDAAIAAGDYCSILGSYATQEEAQEALND